MRILFVVQGEGRGHLTQALSLRQKLGAEGHEVVAALVGKSPARCLPYFFLRKIGVPIHTFESPNFLPTAQNKQVHLTRSVAYNLLRLPKYMRSMHFIARMIRDTQADVVVNFYELLTGLTYALFRPKAAMVCVAHQYLFLHPDFRFPTGCALPLASLRFFTRLTAVGATRKLALSFRKMPEVTGKGLVVVPPLLRQEVLNQRPLRGNYLHGYLLNSGFSEEVQHWHAKHPEVGLHFFWDKRGANAEERVDDTLSFHALDDQLFVQYMAGAKAYATTAGFESVCEAMFLDKPVLMVPTHIEQRCNAYDASLSGAGIISENFNLDKLLSIAEKPVGHAEFRHWVRQADWLILREFREELFREKHAAAGWKRATARWAERLWT